MGGRVDVHRVNNGERARVGSGRAGVCACDVRVPSGRWS